MNKNTLFLILIAAVVIGGLFVLKSSTKQVQPPTSAVPASGSINKTEVDSAIEEGMIDESVRQSEVTARQFKFELAEIRVWQGKKVRLKMKSVDVAHGFAINEYGINIRL